ncbi:hypothetical protein NQZ79_g7067 [Umbelopsis isabellina]|nr:hypothetical protein NQZ79_g7067 [Umbelopsis isabellina]
MLSDSSSTAVTKPLCAWIENLKWDDIPDNVKERCKFLILDGLACAVVGSHLPWSEQAVKAVLRMESPSGDCPLIGWKDRKTGPLPAALLNSAFIQAFELDDYHSVAPLHCNAIILPALLSLVSHQKNAKQTISGKDLLLAMITGCEVGPRVGMALHGGDILSRGWHSGTVFGHPASAAACSKLLGLDKDQIEDAFGIACTQACGLMSAQFESSVKRMQHGFAARNGLFSALMAESRYKGISQVFDRAYGGYLSVFTLGAKPAEPAEVLKELSEKWQILNLNIKPYACMAGIHATIDCVREIQASHTLKSSDIENIIIEMGNACYKHGGWQAVRPLTEMGAQMNNAYIAAAQIIDNDINMKTFASHNLDRDEIWELVPKIQCKHQEDIDNFPNHFDKMCTRMTITLASGEVLKSEVIRPTGVKKPLTTDEIVNKFYSLTTDLITSQQQRDIVHLVSNLDKVDDASELFELFNFDIPSPLT